MHSSLTVAVREQVCGTSALVQTNLLPDLTQAALVRRRRVSVHVSPVLVPAVSLLSFLFSLSSKTH